MRTLPKITIVTPSFNQARYLERTILSVLSQDYPNLEYIIIDGGSSDDSVDIIERYSNRLAYWVSETDNGQTDAINKGLKRATGDWVAWQNSDDIYFPGSFNHLARVMTPDPGVDFIIADIMLIDEFDRHIRDVCYVTPNYLALVAEGMLLANQAAFWRRSVHEEIGWLADDLQHSFDYEWFLRLARNHKGKHVRSVWGALRLHGESKTAQNATSFTAENRQVLKGRELPAWQKWMFKLRRLCLMIMDRRGRYILRGLWRWMQRCVRAPG